MSGRFESNISAGYLRSVNAPLEAVKQLSYSLMRLEDAMRVLDEGCGPGVDLFPIVGQMPDGGVVTGLDYSDAMLAEAAKMVGEQEMGASIRLVQGSALGMPFASGYFDAVRAERLFQVLSGADCPPAFVELCRVLRAGGRMVLADTDWGSGSIAFPDVGFERRMMDFFTRRCRPSGHAARMFRSWMADAAFADVEVHIVPQPMYTLAECPICGWMADEALRQGVLDDAEARHWMDALREASDRGAFYACVNMLVVAGTKKG